MADEPITPPPGYTLVDSGDSGVTPPPGYRLISGGSAPVPGMEQLGGTPPQPSMVPPMVARNPQLQPHPPTEPPDQRSTFEKIAGAYAAGLTPSVPGLLDHIKKIGSAYFSATNPVNIVKSQIQDAGGRVATPENVQRGMRPPIPASADEAIGGALPFVTGGAIRETGVRPAVADALQSSAERGYGQVLGATTKPNKFRSQRVVGGYDAPAPDISSGATTPVPGLLERGVTAITRKGLAGKINETVQDLGQRLELEWGNIPNDAGRPPAEVYKTIDDSLTDAFKKPDPNGKPQSTGPDADAGFEFGQSLKDYLKAHEITDPTTGQATIPYKSIKQFRQSWDDLVAAKNGYSGADFTTNVKGTAYKAAASGMREILNGDNPNVAALNREYKFWADAQKVIGDTIDRTSSQAKPLGRRMAKVGGQVLGFGHGGPLGAMVGGEAMDALEAAVSSPAWKTVSAVTKSRLADALASGSPQQVGSVMGEILAITGAMPRVSAPPATVPGNQIPKFAKGGIIKRPTLLVDAATKKPSGLMAENGPEAIVPLSAPDPLPVDKAVSQLGEKFRIRFPQKRKA